MIVVEVVKCVKCVIFVEDKGVSCKVEMLIMVWEVLVFKDYGMYVVVVMKDGQKFIDVLVEIVEV